MDIATYRLNRPRVKTVFCSYPIAVSELSKLNKIFSPSGLFSFHSTLFSIVGESKLKFDYFHSCQIWWKLPLGTHYSKYTDNLIQYQQQWILDRIDMYLIHFQAVKMWVFIACPDTKSGLYFTQNRVFE